MLVKNKDHKEFRTVNFGGHTHRTNSSVCPFQISRKYISCHRHSTCVMSYI